MLSEQKVKNLINKKAKEYGLFPQQIYGLFGLEQLLLKISESEYKDFFILKGGYLLSAIYGLESRATRDLDATIHGMPLSVERMEAFTKFIEGPDENGNVYFQLRKKTVIREKFEYDGFNLKFNFLLGKSRFPIEIDLTTGENLLPMIKKQEIPLLMDQSMTKIPG